MEQSARLGIAPLLGCLTGCDGSERALEAEARQRGLTVRRFPVGTLPRPGQIRTIIRTIADERIDVVHTHGYKPNIILGLLSRPPGPTALTATLHGWCSTSACSKLRFYEWLEAKALGRFHGIAVVSRRMLEHRSLAGREFPLLRVIHNAVPLEPPGEPPAMPEVIAEFCGRGFTFGAIGRLSPEKDFLTLLEAFAMLRREGSDSRLLLLGEGPQRPVLEERAAGLGLGDRLQLPGYLEGARHCLPLFGAYVLSSTTEGMPMTILEAFAAGVPVISTAVGDIPQMLDQGAAGLLVPPGDAKALAEAMERLLSDPAERDRLAGASLQRSAVYNSAEAMAESYLDFYRQATAAAGSA
jgi:glycosyltransferase involved in cell wall biosynthesis